MQRLRVASGSITRTHGSVSKQPWPMVSLVDIHSLHSATNLHSQLPLCLHSRYLLLELALHVTLLKIHFAALDSPPLLLNSLPNCLNVHLAFLQRLDVVAQVWGQQMLVLSDEFAIVGTLSRLVAP